MQPAELTARQLENLRRIAAFSFNVRQPHRGSSLTLKQGPDEPWRPFPFFSLPAELRLSIYEFVFTPDPPRGRYTLFPLTWETLEPLLTCRQFYLDARHVAFRCAVYNVDWITESTCPHRLRSLEPSFLANLRHVAISTSPNQLHTKLQPLRYHLDHMRQPHLSLDSLTFVLQNPIPSPAEGRRTVKETNASLIRATDMILTAIWYFKNVQRVCVLNILFREFLKDYPSELGTWSSRTEQQDPGFVLWRFELTNFFDYSLEPYLRSQA